MIPDQFRLIALAIAAALLFAAGWSANGWRLGEQIAQMEADQSLALAAAQQQARAEEQRRQTALEIIRNDAQQSIEVAEADAAAAAATADSLQQQVDRLARRPARCPAVADGSEAADPAGLLLADLLRRINERAGQLADYADRARIAGIACEKSYGVLR